MKSTRANKMINMPEGLIVEMENLKSEVHVLRRTVASKTAAVAILHKQLEAAHGYQEEIITPLQHKLTQTDGGDLDLIKDMTLGSPERSPGNGNRVGHSSSSVLAELLSASKRENKALKQDLLDLQCKLHDAQADLKVVRSETPRVPLQNAGPLQQHWHRQERLHLIHSLEELTNKVSEVEGDVRCLNVEREELLRERQHAAATIARLGRQLRETRRDSTAATDVSHRDNHMKGDERGENVSGTESACLTNGIGSMDHCENLKSSLTTSEGIQADGSLRCDADVSTTLLQQNRSLSLKLKEAEMELKRTKAIVADYELLSSLQSAAHHDHRTLAASAHHHSLAGTPPSSILSSAPQPTGTATPITPTTTLAADDSAPVSAGSASVVSQQTDVLSGGQGDPERGSHDVSLESVAHETVMEDACPSTAAASDEVCGNKTRTNAVTRDEPLPVCQEETAPSSSDVVATLDSINATDQPVIGTGHQSSLHQGSRPCDNQADTCTNTSNLETHSNTGKERQAVASLTALQTKTTEKVNASKTVPLQSLSARTFECSASLRSQVWLSGMDEVTSYSPYCAEGLSISDCIEEIVPIDEIDSYVEEVRRTQSKQAASRTGSSPHPASDSGTPYTNRNTLQLQGAGLNGADGKKLDSSHSSNNVSSNVRNSHVGDCSNAPVSKQIEGAVDASGGASIDASTKDEAANGADDAFCDYDSDDDNFEAELQQWQQSADGLLNKAQKRGAH